MLLAGLRPAEMEGSVARTPRAPARGLQPLATLLLPDYATARGKAVLSGGVDLLATLLLPDYATALPGFHGSRSPCHIGWVSLVTTMTKRNEGM